MNTIFVGMLIAFTLMFIVYFIAFKEKDILHKREIGRIPLYTENCSGNFYQKKVWSRALIPFIRLAMYDDFLVLSFSKWPLREGKIVLEFAEIDKVEVNMAKQSLGRTAVYLFYHQGGVSDYLQLWLKGYSRVREIIESKINKARERIGSEQVNIIEPTKQIVLLLAIMLFSLIMIVIIYYLSRSWHYHYF